MEFAAGIQSQWSYSAFVVAAILILFPKFQSGKIKPIHWFAAVALVVVGLFPIGASTYLERIRIADQSRAIYRVRAIVLGPKETPVEDAKVWSSASGEAKRIAGGWQFDIPEGSRPRDGKLSIYASLDSAFLTGRSDMQLGDDRNPTVTVRLHADTGAKVRGIVVDGVGNGIFGARVVIVGYENDAVVTGASGGFALPAHAAAGQIVRLHIQKDGYRAANEDFPAGDSPVTVTMTKK